MASFTQCAAAVAPRPPHGADTGLRPWPLLDRRNQVPSPEYPEYDQLYIHPLPDKLPSSLERAGYKRLAPTAAVLRASLAHTTTTTTANTTTTAANTTTTAINATTTAINAITTTTTTAVVDEGEYVPSKHSAAELRVGKNSQSRLLISISRRDAPLLLIVLFSLVLALRW